MVEESGIYEICFAVFNRESIECLVNGKQIFVINNPGCSDFNGASKIDFLILPARARISLKFWGNNGQGFFSLRKL